MITVCGRRLHSELSFTGVGARFPSETDRLSPRYTETLQILKLLQSAPLKMGRCHGLILILIEIERLELHQFSEMIHLFVLQVSPAAHTQILVVQPPIPDPFQLDRKSTRLNSSHVAISYA